MTIDGTISVQTGASGGANLEDTDMDFSPAHPGLARRAAGYVLTSILDPTGLLASGR